ncbi:MAG TPA: VOC family protein [Acidimicrobiales bacterium]|nr:VOC family protein [Acidimicrobiales bacterium]
MFSVSGMDHIVLIVGDVDASLRFYVDQLGLEPERVDEWRAGEVFFPSVRIDASTIIDLFEGEVHGKNLDHFCMVVDGDVVEIASSGQFEVVDGPGERWGARGIGTSVYVLDPDGNTVELRTYS